MKRRDTLKILASLPVIGWAQTQNGFAATNDKPAIKKARNLILISADGMGACQWQAPGIIRKSPLSVFGMEYCCLVDTLPLNKINGDAPSHCTALGSGVATNSGFVGLDPNGKPVKNLMEYAKEWGMARGIVSANSLVEGSIVPFVAHVRNRMMVEPITAAYVEDEFDVVLGAGKNYFTHKVTMDAPQTGVACEDDSTANLSPRQDGRNLIDELKQKGYAIEEGMDNIMRSNAKRLFGFSAPMTLPNLMQGRTEDVFVNLTEKALELLGAHSNGFMLMIGDMYVDRASHDGNLDLLCKEALNLDQVVRLALDFAKKDGNTLVVVVGTPEASGMTLTHGNPSEGKVEAKWNEPGMIHTGIMVPCFAQGPGAEHFKGSVCNHELFPILMKALEK